MSLDQMSTCHLKNLKCSNKSGNCRNCSTYCFHLFSKNELDANHANHSDCWPVPSATAPVCASTLGWKIPDTIHNHPAKAPMVSGGVYDLCAYTRVHIICMYRDMLKPIKLSSIHITKYLHSNYI